MEDFSSRESEASASTVSLLLISTYISELAIMQQVSISSTFVVLVINISASSYFLFNYYLLFANDVQALLRLIQTLATYIIDKVYSALLCYGIMSDMPVALSKEIMKERASA